MKRYISLMITAVLLAVLVALPAEAAGTGALAMADVSGKPGDTVAMDVKLTANPGLVTLGIKVEYDTNVLQLTEVKVSDVLKGAQLNKNYSSPYAITWIDGASKDNNTATGTIATFYFQIKDTAPVGESQVVLNFLDSYCTDYSANQFTTTSGAVMIGKQDSVQKDPTDATEGNDEKVPVVTVPAVTVPEVTVPAQTAPTENKPAATTPTDSVLDQTAPTEIATEESVESKDESAQNAESDVITIGTLPAEETENQEKDPAFPWWILLVLIPGIGVAVALIIKKVKK